MDRCIYCLKEGVIFSAEHVIPKSFGVYKNHQTPTLNNLVCSECNQYFGDSIDKDFKENSIEGFRAFQLGYTNSKSKRWNENEISISHKIKGIGEFDGVVGLKSINGNYKIDIFSHYIIGSIVFKYDKLKSIKETGGKDFERMKKRLENINKSSVEIYTEPLDTEYKANKLHELMVNLLKEYGVYYNKKIDFSEKLDSCAKLNEKITGIITENIYRAITKIAFNYFAFCCNEDCNINILHHDSFSYLKKFVRYGSDDRILRNNIINITNEDVLRIEKEDGGKLLTHKIVFFCDNGNIYSNISFNGCFTYKVKLSNGNIDIKSITKYNINDFGCGHMFDPNDDKILRLVNRYNGGTDEAKPKYGLDKRNS